MSQDCSRLLPPEAVKLLQEAARTPITKADRLARQKAIEHAIAKVRRSYPNNFSDDETNPDGE